MIHNGFYKQNNGCVNSYQGTTLGYCYNKALIWIFSISYLDV